MKSKWLLTGLVSTLLLAAGQFFFLTEWFRESGIEFSGWSMMLWIAVAIALSMWMIQCLIEKLSSVTSRGSRIGSYIGGCGVYQFALFLGFIVGGNFVGAVGDNFIGDTGTVLGIGIFIFYVTIVACSTGALIGFLPGGLTQRFTR